MDKTDNHESLAIGGPLGGKKLSAATDYIVVPIRTELGWRFVNYEFKFGMWICHDVSPPPRKQEPKP